MSIRYNKKEIKLQATQHWASICNEFSIYTAAK